MQPRPQTFHPPASVSRMLVYRGLLPCPHWRNLENGDESRRICLEKDVLRGTLWEEYIRKRIRRLREGVEQQLKEKNVLMQLCSWECLEELNSYKTREKLLISFGPIIVKFGW
jgi:hypothetical protein